LPPAWVGESSIVTNLRRRIIREGSPERASRLFERASATTVNRCVGSVAAAPCACEASANRRLTVTATSTADAYCSGITTGSLPLGWSMDSMIFARRWRLFE
jgi:hypothetical protein